MNLPSQFQIGATVDVNFQNSKILKSCKVAAVKFTDYGKVFYDIIVPVGFETESTLLSEIDSALITEPIMKSV